MCCPSEQVDSAAGKCSEFGHCCRRAALGDESSNCRPNKYTPIELAHRKTLARSNERDSIGNLRNQFCRCHESSFVWLFQANWHRNWYSEHLQTLQTSQPRYCSNCCSTHRWIRFSLDAGLRKSWERLGWVSTKGKRENNSQYHIIISSSYQQFNFALYKIYTLLMFPFFSLVKLNYEW